MLTRTKRFALSLSAAVVALAVLCFVPVGYAEGAEGAAATAAAALPQVDASNPLLAFALGAVSMAFVMIVAMFIYRNRSHHLH